MKFNQDFIDSFNICYFENLINGKEFFTVDSTSMDSKQQHIFVAFQHYLIKYFINTPNPTQFAKKYVTDYYLDFYMHPDAYVSSPFLNSKTIEFFNAAKAPNVIAYRDRYYDAGLCSVLYKRYMDSNITDVEKDRLFAFLTLKLKDKSYEQKHEDIIKLIIKNNKDKKLTEINTNELKYYCQYVSNYALVNSSITSFVNVGKAKPSSGGFQNNYYIFINQNSSYRSSLAEITATVCHESEHSMQKKAAGSKTTRNAFEYAYVNLFSKYLNKKGYDSYHDNYRYTEIELDAEKFGYFYGATFMRMFGYPELADDIHKAKEKSFVKRDYYSHMKDEEGTLVSIDKYIVTNLNKIISEHPEELNHYPVLNTIYNKDGSRKQFGQILYTKCKEDVETRGIVDNFITYGINHDELSTVKINPRNKEVNGMLFKNLASMYRTSALTLKDYFDDSLYNEHHHDEDPVVVETTAIYQIAKLYFIIEYVNKNISTVLDTKEDGVLNNRSYLYDFIYDFRDFKFEQIKNPVLKNSKKLNGAMDRLMTQFEFFTMNYNKTYIDDKMSSLSSEDRKAMVENPNGGEIPFETLMYDVILPNLDGHMCYNHNGRQIYVGDIIGYNIGCIKNKKNNNPPNKLT